eukprot:7378856-Prymnesium_polylepis.1
MCRIANFIHHKNVVRSNETTIDQHVRLRRLTMVEFNSIVVQRVPLRQSIKIVERENFTTHLCCLFDLVGPGASIGHACDIPLLVARPPHTNARAGGETIGFKTTQ